MVRDTGDGFVYPVRMAKRDSTPRPRPTLFPSNLPAVKCSEAQLGAWRAAAERDGAVNLSAWVRDVLDAAATGGTHPDRKR